MGAALKAVFARRARQADQDKLIPESGERRLCSRPGPLEEPPGPRQLLSLDRQRDGHHDRVIESGHHGWRPSGARPGTSR